MTESGHCRLICNKIHCMAFLNLRGLVSLKCFDPYHVLLQIPYIWLFNERTISLLEEQ